MVLIQPQQQTKNCNLEEGSANLASAEMALGLQNGSEMQDLDRRGHDVIRLLCHPGHTRNMH